MQDLTDLRKSWSEKKREEAKLIPKLTIQESVGQFFALYRAFAPQLQETESLFGPERRAHLAELQQRLQQIDKWRQEHRGKSV